MPTNPIHSLIEILLLGAILSARASRTTTRGEICDANYRDFHVYFVVRHNFGRVSAGAEKRQPLTTGTIGIVPAAASSGAQGSCANALGIARVVEIDTTGGPGFGFEHFKNHDFLREGEVVLTFDDGPWPRNTPAVLAALAARCTKAIFFPIGKHAIYEPRILKQVAAAGHAIGSHTWSHQDLSKKSVEEGKDEIEKGISAVRWAAGVPTAPYFRFPALRRPPELVTYLGQRNVAVFSTDFDSFDFKMRKPEELERL